MFYTGAQIDANFYQMIHQFVAPSHEEADERRRHERKQSWSTQYIAPWDGCRFPAETDFLELPCNDLTRGGFSFLHSHEPDFNLLVAGFGRKPDLLFVGAEVVRCTPVVVFSSGQVKRLRDEETSIRHFDPSGEPGHPRILVGCRFLRRFSAATVVNGHGFGLPGP
ncbi:MAG: hypothetical protein GXY83_03310 [Rhodopirellula sp.]|nr:hypothetical protein [Rhodopirellula sp.]